MKGNSANGSGIMLPAQVAHSTVLAPRSSSRLLHIPMPQRPQLSCTMFTTSRGCTARAMIVTHQSEWSCPVPNATCLRRSRRE